MQDPLQPLKFPRLIMALTAAAGALALVLAHAGSISPAAAQQAYGNSYGNFFGYDTSTSKQRPAARKKRREDAAKPSSPADAEKETAAPDNGSGDKASDEKAASTKQTGKSVEKSAENSDDRPSGKKGKKKEAKNEAKPDAPKDPVYVVISIADQHVNVYDRDGKIAQSRVSTGKPGHPTPMGVFSVIGKERFHRSNIYSGAPMPWMQRITWSGVAMHAGVVPGYPASHGCIRLPYSFAPQMWGMTKMGARVVVARRDTTPFEISHPLLPVPKMQPAPGTHQAMDARPAGVELASADAKDGASIATAAVPDTGSASGSGDSGASASENGAPGLLNPMQYAAALKKQAALDKAAADKAAKDALAAAQAAGSEARQAVDEVRRAQAAVDAAQVKLAQLDQASDAAAKKAADAASAAQGATQTASSAPGLTSAAQAAPAPGPSADAAAKAASDAALAATAATAARAAAATELEQARAALDQARRHETEKTPASFAAVAAYKSAVAASEAAAELLTQADRRTEPVSVLISRDEGRIFIRQDWKEVWEAPITIRDPEKPLGTHLFIAVAAQPDGSAMRWSAITVPEGAGAGGKRSGSKKDAKASDEAPAVAPSTAAEALDRIELPEGARERIAELLWENGAIIVSDHPRSYEMDNDTDFIVLTR